MMAYEMGISEWTSDVCSSDLARTIDATCIRLPPFGCQPSLKSASRRCSGIGCTRIRHRVYHAAIVGDNHLLLFGQVGSPHVEDQHGAHRGTVVPCFMLYRVAEAKGPSLDPFDSFAADPNAGTSEEHTSVISPLMRNP